MSADAGYIAVDLDGTLAEYHGWDNGRIGKPIPAMVERVKRWLAEGRHVQILTARVSHQDASQEERAHQRELIWAWCEEHLGQKLNVSAEKGFGMIYLFDDRAVQVEKNTGKLIGSMPEFL